MSTPLMPKATALWLVENTALTFKQIADFSGLHTLEIQALADGDIGYGLNPFDPVENGQISAENLEECIKNPDAKLILIEPEEVKTKKKSKLYTPVSKRKDRPEAIAWLLKNCPKLGDAQIMYLLGTTKATIDAVRDRTHKKSEDMTPKHPVTLGICTQDDLDKALREAAETSRENPEPKPESEKKGGA